MKKKLIAVLLCLATTGTLFGCGKQTSMDVDYDVNDYVELGDYKGIDVTVTGDYDVTEETVNDYIGSMINYYKPYVQDETQTTVTSTSVVNVNYVGKLDGKAFDGGSADDVTINMMTNSDAIEGTSYIEGFTTGLEGATVGTTVDCDVTFPEDYSATDLAGKKVTFTFTINYIAKAMTQDQLTDEYVAENFESATVADYLVQANEYVIENAATNKENDTRAAVMEAVEKENPCKEIPEKLLKLRVQEYMDQYEATYCQDTTLAAYLNITYGITKDEFKEQVETTVEENIKVEMVFQAIAEDLELKVDKTGFKSFCKDLMENADIDDTESLYLKYGANEDAGKAYLKRIYLCNKACDYCVKYANVTYQTQEEADAKESGDETTENETDADDTQNTDANTKDATDGSLTEETTTELLEEE